MISSYSYQTPIHFSEKLIRLKKQLVRKPEIRFFGKSDGWNRQYVATSSGVETKNDTTIFSEFYFFPGFGVPLFH